MPRQKKATPATAYSAAVRLALEHFADVEWLGRHSPLASPYFLGRRLEPAAPPYDSHRRGALLQEALRAAAAEMWRGPLPTSRQALAAAVDEERLVQGSKSPRYRYYLLELRYLRRHYPPHTFPTTVEAIPAFVNVSQTRFFVHLDEAIDDLARHVRQRLNPALRLELPSSPDELVGRAETLAALQAALLAGRSAAVTGMGGVGKTTTGAALAARWPGLVFWHTFRPGLNDDLNSVLFNLGHFIHESGAPALWAQLLAGEGRRAPPAEALGLLQLDLETIADRRPLLCFDEVDLLQTSAGDPRRRQHAQVLEFLEGLRGTVPLLLLGQRVYIDTEVHIPLEPLPPDQTAELLRRLGVAADAATLHQVREFTRGNPRLLELYAALQVSGDAAGDILQLPHDPSAQPLFSRLWRRLDQGERALLNALSVFRTYAPGDAWPDQAAALAGLTGRNLVKTDLGGGVALLPFFRELVYAALPPEQHRRLHRQAALLRAGFGDYTAAAYHFVAASDPAAAVQVWYAHQDEEIVAGQAAAAGEVFRPIDPAQLAGPRRAELVIIHNRLALLAGEAECVLEGMERFSWDPEAETTAEAFGQWATALDNLGRTDEALARYDEAIATLARLTAEIERWRLRRGLILSETDLQAARHETALVRYDAERLQGIIDLAGGAFDAARTHLLASLAIAETAQDKYRIARAHHALLLVAGRQGLIDEAEAQAKRAQAFYDEIGDRLQREGVRAELAGIYLNVRQFEAVIAPAEQALRYFERIKHERWIAALSNNLAEAYMETGQLDKARAMVFRVMRIEYAPSQPYALYTLGHIHDREGHPDHAATSFSEGIEIARANEDPFIEAYLQRALGALLARQQRKEEAATHLAAAAGLFTEMGLAGEVAETEAILKA